MKKILIIQFFIWCTCITYGQDKPSDITLYSDVVEVVLLQPTGKTADSLPEMRVLPDTSELYRKTMLTIKNSFVNEFLDLYFIVQVYLKNNNKSDIIEPAYLALTENQGGFAKFGFSLLEEGNTTLMPKTPYVDITVGQATGPPNKLMSFTQLYPHEMGHVFFHLLSPEDSVSNNTKNVNMHFFSLITDYSTAFNEGFAEHIENVSRTYEKNEDIKAGVLADLDKIENSSVQSINGFERDFTYPFRMGYYKASMLNWYQKYEDYKRHRYAFNGAIRYKNKTLNTSKIEDQLTFRNSGVGLDTTQKRNLVQLHSTEGAISSFFTHLTTSELQNHYLDSAFYVPFYNGSDTTVLKSPRDVFTPFQNQFIKYFFVLHNYVVFNNSSKSQLADFIDGYIQSFPAEASSVRKIFKRSLGTEYSNEIPPPIWLLIKNHTHRLVVFDPFDAITVPLYTFDLNAAEVEDLQTIKGITPEAAKKIVKYRTVHGYYTDLKQLKNIEGLSEEQVNQLISAKLDNNYFEETLKDFEPKLSIGTLISSPLKYIFSRAIVSFLLLFGVMYFVSIRRNMASMRRVLLLFIKYFILWVGFVLMGLIFIFLNLGNPYLFPIFLFTVPALIALFVYRKRKIELQRTLIFIAAMNLLLLGSLI